MDHANIQTTMIYAKWGKDRAADRALVDAAFSSDVSQSDRSDTATTTTEQLTPSL